MGLQFLAEGVRRGERVLYITLSETSEELRAVAASHGWTLDGVDLFESLFSRGSPRRGARAIDPAFVGSRAGRHHSADPGAGRADQSPAGGVRQPVGVAPVSPGSAALSPPSPSVEAVLRRSQNHGHPGRRPDHIGRPRRPFTQSRAMAWSRWSG
ncbi:ATPase domain-containing protein [Caulobacter segnis]